MRLAATLRCDFRLQLRNGFYYASALVVAVSIVVLQWLPENAIALLLPVIIFQNVLMNSFYFVAGLTLLENGEGTRAAQVVTPLRPGEYLASKLITLGALSLIESLLISTFVQGVGVGLVPLAIGIALASILLTLVGIALVSRYHAVNEYLMPSVLYAALLSLPLLGWFGVGEPILYAWHPLQGPLDLMGARVVPLSTGRLLLALVWPLLCIGPLYLWSRRALSRRVLA